jgi:hypothetical protein
LSRDLGVSYQAAFVLAHKFREAVGSEVKGIQVGGEGKTVETDGAYFGGYLEPANLKENRIDRRTAISQTGKRKVVVVARERDGRTVSHVFKTERESVGWLTSRIDKGTNIVADEAASWNDLHSRFKVERIDHQEA